MKLSKIDYKTLNSRQQEIYNFQKVAALLADYGFNCIKLADDWQGADFLAFKSNETETLRVQLKSRITIDKKYRGKNIWVAFPHKKLRTTSWYLIEHDSLVEKVGQTTKWLESTSWVNKNGYSSESLNPALLSSLADHKL